MLRNCIYVLLASSSSIPTIALGQIAGAAANSHAEAGDSPALRTGDEIIVTAERRNARLSETPITITALSSEQLSSQGATGVLDLTKNVPGLRMDQYGSAVLPSIRGISTAVSGIGVSSNVAVYLDGFYLATPTQLNFEFPDIDNIQVLKGPQGTLFGRNATGGAIQLTTIDPSNELRGKFTVGYGSYDETVANGYIAGPLTDRLSASISAGWRHTDGYTRNVLNGERDGFYTGWNVRAKLKFEATDSLTLKLQVEHTYINDPVSEVYRSAGETDYPSTQGGIITSQRYRTSSNVPTILKKNLENIFFTAKQDFGGVTLTSLTSYSNEQDRSQFDFDGSSLRRVDFSYSQDVEHITQEVILAGSTGLLEWSAGAFYIHGNGKMPDEAANGFIFNSDQVITDAYAVYADATYNIVPRLYLTGGVRYSHERKKFNFDEGAISGASQRSWESVTPRAVIRFQMQPETSVYGSYSKGFAAGVYSVFSPNLTPADPEKVDAYEVGFKHSQGVVSLNLASFYYKYKDMQYVSYTANQGSVTAQLSNVGRAEIYGAEGDIRLRVAEGLTLYAAAAYTHGKYQDFPGAVGYFPILPGGYEQRPVDASGNRIIRSPRFTGNAGFNLKQPALGGFASLGANLFYMGKSYDDPANQFAIGAHAVLDLTAGWSSADDKWQIQVIGKNVTDKYYINYYDPSSDAILVNDAAPRTVRVQLTRRL